MYPPEGGAVTSSRPAGAAAGPKAEGRVGRLRTAVWLKLLNPLYCVAHCSVFLSETSKDSPGTKPASKRPMSSPEM